MGAYGFGLDFRVRAYMRACVREYVHNHISDMSGLILFSFGTKIKHDGIHMHIMFFDIRSQMADWRPF